MQQKVQSVKTVRVRARGGYFVVESEDCGWSLGERIYDPQVLLDMGAPGVPGAGETITFELKERLKHKNAS